MRFTRCAIRNEHNQKSEIRISKSETNSKFENRKRMHCFEFWNSDLFRISKFGFPMSSEDFEFSSDSDQTRHTRESYHAMASHTPTDRHEGTARRRRRKGDRTR